MKAISSRITKSLNVQAFVTTCDNSGAKMLKITGVKGHKTVKGRMPAAGVGDLVFASVKKGKLEMRKTVVPAIIVREKKRGKLKKYSFGKPNKDGSLEQPYSKIYGLEHLAIAILKKIKPSKKAYEKEVTWLIHAFQIIIIGIGFIIFF